MGCTRSVCPEGRRGRALQPLPVDSSPQVSPLSSPSFTAQTAPKDTRVGGPLSLWFPLLLLSFWAQEGTKLPAVGCTANARPLQASPPPLAQVRDPGAEKEARARRMPESQLRVGAILMTPFWQLSLICDHYFGPTRMSFPETVNLYFGHLLRAKCWPDQGNMPGTARDLSSPPGRSDTNKHKRAELQKGAGGYNTGRGPRWSGFTHAGVMTETFSRCHQMFRGWRVQNRPQLKTTDLDS